MATPVLPTLPPSTSTSDLIWSPTGFWYRPPEPLPRRSYGASSRSLQRNQTTNAERRVSLAAANSALPILYGRVRIAPLIGSVAVTGSTLVVQCIWGTGEIEAIEQLYLDGNALPVTVTATHYLGTTTQTVDPTLSSLVTDYTDTLVASMPAGNVGVAYSVLQIPATVTQGWPRIEAIIQGRKVYDPRTTSTAYSNNPALMLADYLSDARIGVGNTIDWTTVETAADAADAVMSDSSPRRSAGLVLDLNALATEHAEVLRTYAGVFITQGSSGLRLVPNRPASVTRSLTDSDIVAGTMVLKRRKQQDTPTQVEVVYTDTSETEGWEDAPAVAVLAGVNTNTIPRRISRVYLPGVQSYSQAYREAVERLNAATLSDLTAEWVTTDEALADEVGDVVSITHSVGLTSKSVRLLDVVPIEPGRWRVSAEEYNASIYSDVVAIGPSYTDTTLPSPLDVPTPGTLSMVEELYVDETGTTYSRMRVTWTGSDWPYARLYRVRVQGNTTVLETTVTHVGATTHSVASGPVTQGVLYQADVYLVSSVGAISETPSTASVTAQGKLLLPTNVTSISGFEAGQFVAVDWNAAIDIDLRGYQVRRLPESDWTDGSDTDWDHSNAITIVERVDATSYLAISQPIGDWRYGVKALDSVGQESPVAAWVAITVTADIQGVDNTVAYCGPTGLVNMHCYSVDAKGFYAITNDGGTWADRFGASGGTWDAVATTGKLWAQEHSVSGGVAFVSDEWDSEVERLANWTWSGAYLEYGTASASKSLLLAPATSGTPSYTEIAGGSAYRSAQYFKAKLTESATGADNVVHLTLPVQLSRQSQPLTQSDTETLTTTGQPLTISFNTPYFDAPQVTVTPLGSSPRIATADNISATGLDLYLWTTSGVAASGSVDWNAYGS